MSFVTNDHVERLSQYQPFDASFSQLFAEYVDTRQSDQIATRALGFVQEAVDRPTSQIVVLTGDAGHGKTHLCGQLIKSLSPEIDDVRAVLRDCADGLSSLARLSSGKDLHVIKDLSELDPEIAAAGLVSALTTQGRVTVVCANEGRLREVISKQRERLAAIQAALDNVLAAGQTSLDGAVWIVNLNHQSVAAPGGKSLVRQALRNWVQDQRKWSACNACEAKTRCPILENRRLLADQEVRGESRRAALETLLRTAEQTSHIITIRELLVFIAHIVTGGLRCTDVHERVSRRPKDDWQYEHLFHEAAFATLLGTRELERLQVFRAMRLLDPGERAMRLVDDRLHLGTNDDVGRYSPPMRNGEGSPRSRKQHQAVADIQQDLYRFYRRRNYFDAEANEDNEVEFSERLGFRHYNEYEKLIEPGVTELQTVHVRDAVLSGLEALQGIRRTANQGSFAVVDPAFSSHRGNASVIAAQIPKGQVRLLSQTSWWHQETGREPDLADSVDWVDRRIYVVVPDFAGKPHAVDLDCRQFELVCRAAAGLVSRAFFQADIRRIAAQLATIESDPAHANEITVVVNGRPAKLVIDVGDVIVATGA